MSAIVETLTAEQAESLESAFLGGLEEAQFAYERIVESQAWTLLGFDRFATWWDERVTPTMRALSMRPTREIQQAVVEQVRKEEAELPPAQRRTQRELAEMVGVNQSTVSRSTSDAFASRTDLEPAPDEDEPPLPVELPKRQEHADAALAAIDQQVQAKANVSAALDELVPDPDGPRRQWQIAFLGALRPSFKLMAQFAVEHVANNADEECLDELARLADQIASYRDRVRAARPIPDNVRHLRSVS